MYKSRAELEDRVAILEAENADSVAIIKQRDSNIESLQEQLLQKDKVMMNLRKRLLLVNQLMSRYSTEQGTKSHA